MIITLIILLQMIKQSQINSFINLIVHNHPNKKSKRYKSFQKNHHCPTEPSVFKKQNQCTGQYSNQLINHMPIKIKPKICHNIKVKLPLESTINKSPEKLSVYQIYRQSLQKKRKQFHSQFNDQRRSLEQIDKKENKSYDTENGSKQLFFPINRPKISRNSGQISTKSLKKRQLSTPMQNLSKFSKLDQRLACKRSLFQIRNKLELGQQNWILSQGSQNVQEEEMNKNPTFRVKKCLMNNSSDDKVNKVYAIFREQISDIKKKRGFQNRKSVKDKISNHINNKKLAFLKGQTKLQIKSNRLISFQKVDPWDYDFKDDSDICENL